MFFDLEGDIFAADGGLEYLSLDPPSEKRVFERFIDDVMARWE